MHTIYLVFQYTLGQDNSRVKLLSEESNRAVFEIDLTNHNQKLRFISSSEILAQEFTDKYNRLAPDYMRYDVQSMLIDYDYH